MAETEKEEVLKDNRSCVVVYVQLTIKESPHSQRVKCRLDDCARKQIECPGRRQLFVQGRASEICTDGRPVISSRPLVRWHQIATDWFEKGGRLGAAQDGGSQAKKKGRTPWAVDAGHGMSVDLRPHSGASCYLGWARHRESRICTTIPRHASSHGWPPARRFLGLENCSLATPAPLAGMDCVDCCVCLTDWLALRLVQLVRLAQPCLEIHTMQDGGVITALPKLDVSRSTGVDLPTDASDGAGARSF